jgi:endonuclease YncB( thermonuclease family)
MIKVKVNRVVDGDTLDVSISSLRIRMDFVDAPETHGPEKEAGLITKQWLKDRVEGKVVEIEPKNFDMYFRLVATVFDELGNINGDMIKKGLVEIYDPKLHDNGVFDK